MEHQLVIDLRNTARTWRHSMFKIGEILNALVKAGEPADIYRQSILREDFGMSILYTGQEPAIDFLLEVLRHINGILYTDRATGQFKITLVRDDYEEGSLPEFDESNILDQPLDNFRPHSF